MEKKKILLVEDNKSIAKFMKQVLTQEGYLVGDVVSSGEKAIELACDTHPDLILMNIELNGKVNGLEAYKRIKTLKDIPIIFVTAYAGTSNITKTILNTTCGYLVKPFRIQLLIQKVEQALS